MSTKLKIDLWLNNVLHLAKQAYKAIRDICYGLNCRKQGLKQMFFQAYTYMLIATLFYKNRSKGDNLNLHWGRGRHSHVFIFKPVRAREVSNYSYFILTTSTGNRYLLFNVDIGILFRVVTMINLDIVLTSSINNRQQNRSDVIFFVECKATRSLIPEQLATIIGQRYLVKLRDATKWNRIPDVLASPGRVSYSISRFFDPQGLGRWRLIHPIGNISPYHTGELELEKHLKDYVIPYV